MKVRLLVQNMQADYALEPCKNDDDYVVDPLALSGEAKALHS
jgi:hypothetical protein